MKELLQPAYDKIGKFDVKRVIRSTGSSDLYECYDPDLDIKVALKIFIIKKRLMDKLPYSRESWQRRFINEARLLARIDHPHVIGVRELSSWEGLPYYVMPYIETNLLFEMGRDGDKEDYAAEVQHAPEAQKLSVARSCEILFQTASALAAFHGRGLVHRDIKPANILLTKLHTGLVKLCDPGMVKFPKSEESQAGYWVGTEDFIAPEQKRSAKDVDARADIYALGVLGYRMLVGELPGGVFSGPKEEVAEVPDSLNDLIMRSMSRKVKRRPMNALEFLKEIAPIRAQVRTSQGVNNG
ncbi:putative serine/threonine-protein kinase pknL [Candidatus Terasakiella magnetica]|uniref:Putative serine/threonine-protein kinase pknL n=1 Tax=Candidatus Terasakiella magnetica TaxID=1867952 RepID=A0A1C3RK81_9PROT|nr:serine/threonine-protein kinase [Candidatus Terasakiella magnetica]SCA57730.1 putative serine/threonine-protein kinase pknL [Candidatus Terasakiella magnetica]